MKQVRKQEQTRQDKEKMARGKKTYRVSEETTLAWADNSGYNPGKRLSFIKFLVDLDVCGPGVVARALERIRKLNPSFKKSIEQLLLSSRLCTRPLVPLKPEQGHCDYTLQLLGECISSGHITKYHRLLVAYTTESYFITIQEAKSVRWRLVFSEGSLLGL